jgi:tetratricopeptide (TPR) repeat protein
MTKTKPERIKAFLQKIARKNMGIQLPFVMNNLPYVAISPEDLDKFKLEEFPKIVFLKGLLLLNMHNTRRYTYEFDWGFVVNKFRALGLFEQVYIELQNFDKSILSLENGLHIVDAQIAFNIAHEQIKETLLLLEEKATEYYELIHLAEKWAGFLNEKQQADHILKKAWSWLEKADQADVIASDYLRIIHAMSKVIHDDALIKSHLALCEERCKTTFDFCDLALAWKPFGNSTERLTQNLKKAEEKASDAFDYNSIAQLYIDLDDHTKATEMLDKAIQLSEDVSSDLWIASTACYDLKNATKTREVLNIAESRDFNSYDSLSIVESWIECLQDDESAAKLLDQIPQKILNNNDYIDLCDSWMKYFTNQREVATILQMLEECDDSLLDMVRIAESYMIYFNDVDHAKKILEKTEKKTVYLVEYIKITNAWTNYFNDFERAQQIMSKVEKKSFGLWDKLTLATHYYFIMHDVQKASSILYSIDTDELTSEELVRLSSEFKLISNDEVSALKMLEKAKQKASEFKDFACLASHWIKENNGEKALETMRLGIEKAQSLEEILYAAQIYFSEDVEKARSLLDLAYAKMDKTDLFQLVQLADKWVAYFKNQNEAERLLKMAELLAGHSFEYQSLSMAWKQIMKDELKSAELDEKARKLNEEENLE